MATSAKYQAIIALGAKMDSSFGKTMSKAQKNITAFGKSLGKVMAVGAGAATAGLIAATKSAADLQAQMSNVGTLLDGNVNKRLKELQTELLAVSNTTGVVTSDLTDGLYQIISAVGDSADVTKQMELAAKSAKAANATTTDSINLLTAVTKGYNDTSFEAMQKASDLAFQTLKLGQTSYPELAASMGSVIPLASALKGSQEDLFGAFATLTGVTGSTAEVSTQLRGIYQGFLQPSKNMAAAMQKLGYADGQVMMETLGLQGSLEALKDAVGGNDLAFANLFGSVRAQTAALAISGAQADNLTKKTAEMYKVTGMTDAAFAKQTNNLIAMASKMKNLGKNALTTFGIAILPYVQKAAEKYMPALENAVAKIPDVIDRIAPIAIDVFEKTSAKAQELSSKYMPIVRDAFLKIPGIIKKIQPVLVDIGSKAEALIGWIANTGAPNLIGAVGKTVGFVQRNWKIISPILTGVGAGLLTLKGIMVGMAIVKRIGKVISIVKSLGGVIGLLSSPIGIAVLAIAGLVAAGVAIYQNWDTIKEKAGELWAHIQGVFGGIGDWFSGIWDGVKGTFKAFINFIIKGLNKIPEGLNTLKVDIPSWVPNIGGESLGFNIPTIPLFAKGTRNFRGGPAVVGEKGAELLNLPRGTDVYSNRQTRSILSSPLDFESGFGDIVVTVKNIINGPITKEQANEAAVNIEKAVEAALARLEAKRRRTSFQG